MKKQVRLKSLVLAVALVAGSQNSFGLGLGKLNVESTLGEPLSAHIPFTSVTDKEKKKLDVTLAPRRDFEAAGLDYPDFLSGIKVEKKIGTSGGVDQVIITTRKPVREPVVHLLLKVDWAEGRLMREYTALLDPPVFKDKKEISMPTPAVSTPVVKKPSPARSTRTVTTRSRSGNKTVNPTAAAPRTYGPVREGETLWSISEKTYGVSDVRLLQAMVSVLKNNPDAFIKHNVHGLMAGTTLKMPSIEQATSISTKRAYREFVAQTEQWKSLVQKSSGVPALAGTELSNGTENATPATQAKVKGKAPEAAPAESGGKLEIIVADNKSVSGEAVPEGSSQTNAESSQLKKRVAVLEEALASKESESSELLERVQLLEEQLNKARQLIQVQNAELSRIQDQMVAGAKNPAPDKVASTVEDTPGAAAQAEGNETPSIAAASGQLADQTETEIQQADAGIARVEESANPVKTEVAADQESGKISDRPMFEERSVENETVAGAAAAAGNAGDSPENTERPRIVASDDQAAGAASLSFMDKAKEMFASVRSGSYFLPLLGGLALGGLGLLFVRRRRSVAEFEESILATSTFETQSDFGASIDETKAETTFLNDFGANADQADLEDVDPITEAEVYLAYGRVDQAAEILEDAIEKNPERQELKLKLLEVFSQKGDVKSFETLAEEMYSVSGRDPAIWGKVSDMGREISPGNPLFAAADIPDVDIDTQKEVEAEQDDDSTVLASAPVAPAGDEPNEKVVDANEITGAGKASAEPFAGMSFGDETISAEPEVHEDSTPENSIQEDSKQEDSIIIGEKPLDPDALASDESESSNPLDVPSFEGGLDFTQSEDINSPEPLADIQSMDEGLSLEPNVESVAPHAPEDAVEPDQTIEASSAKAKAASSGDDVLDFDNEIPIFSDFSDSALPEGILGEASATGSDTGDWDENTTKLDLAKAYIDMGDGDGARSILGEVLNQGSEEQKQQAAELMTQAS